MEFRNTASFGKRQEYLAVAELLKKGFDVYMTLVDDMGIDCIIRKSHNQYFDIQIKALTSNCLQKDAGRFSAMTINPRPNYIFVFYSESVDTYWIIPSNDVIKLARKNAGKYHLLLTGVKDGKSYPSKNYEKYINNFEILQ